MKQYIKTINIRLYNMKHKYVCIRCAYKTEYKSSMYNHFYRRKETCKQLSNNIELTNEIKEHILTNFIYMIPKVPRVSIKNTTNVLIQNFNMMNQFVANMSNIEKISQYTGYNNTEIQDFNEMVESKYIDEVNQMEHPDEDNYGVQTLDTNALLDVIDNVSKTWNGSYMNMIYDTKNNKINIYEGVWEEMLAQNGLIRVLTTIQDNYLDAYEIYLIRTIETTPSYREKARHLELLKEYYKFISSFGLPARVDDMTNGHILNNRSVSLDLSERYWSIFAKIRDNQKRREVCKMKRDVIEIIKRNSNQCVEEMNKTVVELIHMDEKFKHIMLSKISGTPIPSRDNSESMVLV